jgi:nucleotide-binding universal stress UspA family protein
MPPSPSLSARITTATYLIDVIAAAVDRHQIDLIVMGSTGMGTFARLFLGSVAMAVAQDSKVPVTLVK